MSEYAEQLAREIRDTIARGHLSIEFIQGTGTVPAIRATADTEVAALIDRAREDQRRADLAEMNLLSQRPEFETKNWRQAVHDFAKTRMDAPPPEPTREEPDHG